MTNAAPVAPPSGPAHISHSALTTWTQCGEQYRLSRVLKVPEAPAWYFWGGSAVHSVTERWDLGEQDQLLELMFVQELHKQIEGDGYDWKNPPDNARTGGRKPEGYAWWVENGPIMAQRWIDWRNATGWAIFDDPDLGLHGVELKLEPEVAGVPVRAYLDRLFVDGNGQLVVVDLKCGSRTPSTALQLGLYAELVHRVIGVRPSLGGFFMARQKDPGKQFAPEGLDLYDDAYFERYVSEFMNARHSGVFVPSLSSMCKSCGVAQFCWAVGGKEPEATLTQ